MSQPGDQSRPLPLRNPDGSWRHTNALATQTSPYLLQHAHNPVDWHPWGPEAFEQARRLDRPIFLSVGYSTCYWCHVMERQCFEDPAIAAVMNAHFVNIKVDREERPDVDDLYMAAVQLMTGHGGWPMSVFLTPPTDPQHPAAEGGLLPFYAGTYFPPTPSPHMPGFPQLLEALAAAWRERRDQVLQQARHTAGELHAHQQRLPDPSPLSVGLVQSAANQLARMHDPEHGGFGDAPKFPQASNLQLLLKVHRNRPNADLWHALTHTLDRMARGGIFDQVAGGFHRYSTDREWLVPHFEKMLYDHGQLVEVYLDAAGIGAHPGDATLFARVVHDTCDYVLREMTDASGAFWSAQDAEAQAREGANYVWTAAQFDEAMKPHAGELAMARALYGVDQGPNFRDPHQPGPTTLNVLYQPVALDEFARGRGMALEQAVALKGRVDAVLRRARSQRPRPATDDKVLAGWNGMMIAALARAGRELDEPRYIAAAGRAARAVLDHMRDAQGRLLRSMRHGKAHIAAFLEDYAFLMHGLLELHRSAPEQGWRDAAETLERVSREEFGAAEPEAGYYDVPADHGDLLLRSRSIYDGAIPSGNSQMTHNLIDLFEITGREEYLARAAASLRFFAGSMRAMGANMAHMHHALLRAMELDPSLDEANAAAASRREEKEPVRTWVEPATVAVREGTAKFRVNLDILPGYHLHAPDGEDEGVAVVNVRVEPAEAWETTVAYPPGTRRRYAMADGPVSVYEGVVTLGVSLRRRAGATEAQPEAVVLRYQACTERACLESREAPLAVAWDVERGGGGVA